MKRLVALPLLVCASLALGQEKTSTAEAKKETETKKESREKETTRDNIVTTQHTTTIEGQAVRYTARAGTIVMKDEDGNARASVFFISYTKDGVDPGRRPIMFTFNGGPGSSSVWLHMGAYGPKRVVYGSERGDAAAPPYKSIENEYGILDVTDLVFIDPVTTGYSRAIPSKEDKKFHAFDADVELVGEFIRLYTTRYARWASPKFLSGESYGTTRAAGLAGWLQDQGFYLNGIALVSSILNFQTARFDSGNDLPYILFLPTYTATAWYHKRLPAELQSQPLATVAAEAERFALGEYTAALMKGDRISAEEKSAIVARLARFTGLSPEYLERTNMRIHISRFDKELMRDQRRTVGRLDSRFTGVDIDAAGEEPEFDPSYASIMGEYTAVLNDYVRRELKFETDIAYEILTNRVSPWRYEKSQNRYTDVTETLRKAMAGNPHLKVYVANGYYDLATPFAATNYTFARAGLEPDLRKNVSMDYLEGGHMMYVDRKAHAALRKGLVDFIRHAVPAQ